MNRLEHYDYAANLYLGALSSNGKSAETVSDYYYTLAIFREWLVVSGHAEQEDDTEITPMMIVEFYTWLSKERGVGQNTIRYRLIVLRVFFTWAVKKENYKKQPINEDDIPKKQKVNLDLLSEEEIETILSGRLPKWSKPATALRNRAIVVLLIESGMRASELCALKWKDIDWDGYTIVIPHGKGDKERRTTFPQRSQNYIREYRGTLCGANETVKTLSENDYVFYTVDENGNRVQFSRINLTAMIRGYVRRLIGRNDIGAHDLRHAYASMLLTNGVSLENIQQVLGHSNYATTVIYASHLQPKRVPQNLNAVFDNIGKKHCASSTPEQLDTSKSQNSKAYV